MNASSNISEHELVGIIDVLRKSLREAIASGSIKDGDLVDFFDLMSVPVDDTVRAYVIKNLDGYSGDANRPSIPFKYHYK